LAAGLTMRHDAIGKKTTLTVTVMIQAIVVDAVAIHRARSTQKNQLLQARA
jgi:hypothetical protein